MFLGEGVCMCVCVRVWVFPCAWVCGNVQMCRWYEIFVCLECLSVPVRVCGVCGVK